MRLFFRRLATLPFEGLIAGLVIVSGIAGLFGVGDANVLDKLLPEWVFTSLQLSYGLSGVLMILGMGMGRGNVEAGGLVLLVSAIAVRYVGLGLALGFFNDNVVLLLTLYVMVVISAGVRFYTIVQREQLIRLNGEEHGDS